MSYVLRPWLLILPALLLLASFEIPQDTDSANGQATATQPVRRKSRPKPPPPRRLKITISKETTHIVTPLRPDGYVDYRKALNEQAAKGVTPENNAAVLLWQVMGPKEINKDVREEFFKLLGIDALPQDGQYVVTMDDHIETLLEADRPQAYDEFEAVLLKAWSEKDYPHVASWLKANEKFLELGIEASKRPHFFSPLVVSKEGFWNGLLLDSSVHDGAIKPYSIREGLRTRAMKHWHAGRTERAWSDLLACHRLARLVDQKPGFVPSAFAFALDQQAGSTGLVLAHSGKLTSQQAKRFAADLAALPPVARDIVDDIDVCGRYETLVLKQAKPVRLILFFRAWFSGRRLSGGFWGSRLFGSGFGFD
ncbi:MAG: hypothetical protein IID44_23465, partial [Planctomycetes bacterium]|nr:hypothetical protein [Planctomycetota bacterium]